MVERVRWFSPIHYEIVEFFEAHDVWITARGLSENVGYDRNYTVKECKTLVAAGLLEKRDTVYALSDRGRAYLDGELDGRVPEPDEG